MPPVREASTKPSAATVLPAPVACSNQKRRRGAGVLELRVGRRPPPRPPRPDPSRAAPRRAARRPRSRPRRWAAPRLGAGRAVGALAELQLGLQRDQRARQGVHLVGVERRAVGQVRLLVGEQPLEAEHQRIGAPPLDRRLAATGVQLRYRVVERRAARACRARAPDAGSSPGSTKLSRANSSARERTSPETGASAKAELVSATFGVLVMGRDGAELACLGSQRGPPVVPVARESHASGEPAGPMGTVGVDLLQHTNRRNGPCCGKRSASVRRMRASRPVAGLALFGCGSDDEPAGAAPARARSWTAAETSSRRSSPSSRQAGGREQVGVLVRAVPRRVPLLPRPGPQAQGRGRLRRRRRQRQRRRRARVPRRQPGPLQALQGPEARDRGILQRRAGVPDDGLLRHAGELAFVHQGGYPSRVRARGRTSTATLADLWKSGAHRARPR